MRIELLALIGCPSFSQVMAGRGIPEASQLRATGFFTTTVTFSGHCTQPIIAGGTEQEEKNKGKGHKSNVISEDGLQKTGRKTTFTKKICQ